MSLIAEWLRARGVFPGHTENSTESQALDSPETPVTSAADELSVLDNENSTQLTTDPDTKTNRTDQNATALTDEQPARKS